MQGLERILDFCKNLDIFLGVVHKTIFYTLSTSFCPSCKKINIFLTERTHSNDAHQICIRFRILLILHSKHEIHFGSILTYIDVVPICVCKSFDGSERLGLV